MHVGLRRRALTVMQQVGIAAHIGRSRWRRKRLLVLCYHGVARWDEHKWNPTLYVSQRLFARRMELLRRRRCNVLGLGEAIERLARGDLPERAVVLTFDDGYCDFLTTAYPVLKSYGFPATVYLPTLRCEHNLPVVRLLLSYMLWHCRGTTLDGADLAGLEARAYSLATPELRAALVHRLLASGNRGHNRFANDGVARQVAERLRLPYEHFVLARLVTLLSPAEVAGLAREGIAFELHTHQHETPAAADSFLHEIRLNRERIEAITGRRPLHFCWPSGLYRREHLPLLEAEGVLSATTCDRGLATQHHHPLLLPRFVDTSEISEAEFTGWVEGTGALMPRRPARAGQISHAPVPEFAPG